MARMPPIAALRAFEAAARRLNFTKAADELNLTQSAISHQIRHLEELWGLRLFIRRPRQLLLTRSGEALAPVLRDFFLRMKTELEALRAEGVSGTLRVSLLQSFALKWLVPRLARFREEHPKIDVWISTNDKYVDFDSDDVDVAIRLGHGVYPRLHTTLLLREHVFPVCSPRFLERTGAPSAPKDLIDYPLLLRVGEERVMNWDDWLRAAGVNNFEMPHGPSFPDTNMAVQAAIDGQGIALARSAHVGDDLAAGRLVRLFNVHCPSNLAYYVVCPKGSEDRPKVAAFRNWLLREASIAQSEYHQAAS